MQYVPPRLSHLVDFYLTPVVPGNLLRDLQANLSELSVELVPIHQKLVMLRRMLSALVAKENPSKTELKPLQEELRKIDRFVTFHHPLFRN